jgi:intein-encoded DNA endonuclease-like protein
MRLNIIKPQSENLTLAKTRLVARLKGDGSIFIGGRRRTNYYVKYEAGNESELKQFSDDIREVYGLETKEQMHRSGKNPNKMLKQVFIRSKLAFEDLQKYGPYYSRTWVVPEQIKDDGREIQAEFLRVFFEDEGSVIISKGCKEVRLYSINLEGLEELAQLLRNFRIESSIRSGFGLKRNVYAIIIKVPRDILNFRDSIGFRSEVKNLKLDNLISKLKL